MDIKATAAAGFSGRTTGYGRQDIFLQNYLADFVREETPDRAVFPKGAGAFGTFTVTNAIPSLTKAKIFRQPGNTCKIFARFSAFTGEKGNSDASMDLRGFALKFYTEEGNWDLACASLPVFYVKDGRKFPDLVHALGRDPKTNLHSPAAAWDFFSQNPETLHLVLMMLSGRGTPKNFRLMDAFSANTFSFINDKNVRIWVKFHLKSVQGTENLSDEEAGKLCFHNPDFAHKDLADAIVAGDYPKWKLFVQTMTDEQAAEWRWDPFDSTKVWFHGDFPLTEVGILELNELPGNYREVVEQAAFSPSNVPPGIGFSPDKILQSRLLAYADAQRYRLGHRYRSAEVNKCPLQQANFMENGTMDPAAVDSVELDTAAYRGDYEDDHYTQAGLFYSKALKTEEERGILVENIIKSMRKIEGPKAQYIIFRQICHFFRANIELGMKIAAALNVNIDASLMNHIKEY